MSSTSRHNGVFLLQSIYTLLLSVPSLVLSLTKSSDDDPLTWLLWRPSAIAEPSSLRDSLTKDLTDVALWLIALHGLGYYLVYRDGAQNHPMFVGSGAASKLVGVLMRGSWFAQGHATALILIVVAVPEIAFGLYMFRTWWWDMGAAWKCDDDASSGSTANPRIAPGNWLFGFAAAHAFFLAFPVLLFNVTGNSDKDVGLLLMFEEPAVQVLNSSGIARDWLQFFTWTVIVLSFGYYRVYADGASAQPLMVLLGGIGKLGISFLLYGWHAGGRAKAGIALGYVVDCLLGLYFLKVYWVDLAGRTTKPAATGSAPEAKKKQG